MHQKSIFNICFIINVAPCNSLWIVLEKNENNEIFSMDFPTVYVAFNRIQMLLYPVLHTSF